MSHIPTTVLPFPELASTLPVEDVIALGGLESARQARIWTGNRIEECRKYLVALIAFHNTIAPIHTLPNELLMKIFASFSELTMDDASWMVSLGHVCRRWRPVVFATPEFWVKPLEYWTDLENDDGQNHLLPVFLDRSSPCPLELSRFELWSKKSYYGWAKHFARITVLRAGVEYEDEVGTILQKIISKMNRLEQLKLDVPYGARWGVSTTLDLHQWEAESFPRLGCLEITGAVFCRATTVPSLHTLILLGPRGSQSMSCLLDGLEGCPALSTLRVKFDIFNKMDKDWSPVRVLDLPNLRWLTVGGNEDVIHCFLSCISCPASAARIALLVDGHPSQPVLPNILPTSFSILHMSPKIDRLFLQSDVDYKADPFLSMKGFVHGAERLVVNPVLWIHRADDVLRFLEVFRVCTVTVLALDLRRVAGDMDGDFWRRFFAAFPDLRRLQLLSCTVESREIKREIAQQFLASSRSSHQAAYEISLAWVLHADKEDMAHLEKELSDVKQVLGGYGQQGARLGRLELYVTSGAPRYCQPQRDDPQVVDVTHFELDDVTKWHLMRDYISQLAEGVEVVTVGGQAELRADDEDNDEDGFEDDGPNDDDAFGDESDSDGASEEGCVEEYEDEDKDKDEERTGSPEDAY